MKFGFEILKNSNFKHAQTERVSETIPEVDSIKSIGMKDEFKS